jgi:hypothetical protein
MKNFLPFKKEGSPEIWLYEQQPNVFDRIGEPSAEEKEEFFKRWGEIHAEAMILINPQPGMESYQESELKKVWQERKCNTHIWEYHVIFAPGEAMDKYEQRQVWQFKEQERPVDILERALRDSPEIVQKAFKEAQSLGTQGPTVDEYFQMQDAMFERQRILSIIDERIKLHKSEIEACVLSKKGEELANVRIKEDLRLKQLIEHPVNTQS